MPPSALETPVPEDAPVTSATQLPWSQIPKFVPGVTNVQEYAQKLKFLASLWPVEHLELLAPRVALQVEGSAFKMISRIDPTKLKVTDVSGVAAIVEAIGGSWGSTELEERYEYFEKALYGTIQKSDESHDSYLSRMDANFVELISRGTTLEEVRAYVLLRQSTLLGDDKKRILLEHGGDLKYQPVVKSFRLLGSKFFSEFQSGRSSQKTRVYDVNMTETMEGMSSEAPESYTERAFHAQSEDYDVDLDQDFVDALVSQEDADAMVVASFEAELEEFLQDTPQMYEAMTTYVEARSKLLEKKKSRGFWPVKGRGKGSSKGKGKPFGKRARDRDQLLAKIARSHCRKCGQLGHWKAECPNAPKNSANSPATASANVVIDERPQEIFQVESMLEEVMSEDELEKPTSNEAFSDSEPLVADCFTVFCPDDRKIQVAKLGQRMNRFIQSIKQPIVTDLSIDVRLGGSQHPKFHAWPRKIFAKADDCREVQTCRQASPVELLLCDHVYISQETHPTHAILDTGASRCIIGEKTLEKLQHALPYQLNMTIRRQPSGVKFRFGNNQSLTSMYAIQVPLKHVNSRRLWLSIEVVPGNTPFLFSKKAFKMLHGMLDAQNDTCKLRRVQHEDIPLAISPTGLYLLNMLDICVTEDVAFTTEFLGSPVNQVTSNGEKLESTCGKQADDHSNSTTDHCEAQPKRAFRAKPKLTSTDAVPSERQDAAHGFDFEDSGRFSDSTAHAASSSVCSPVGEARDHVRERAGSRPGRVPTAPRDDARAPEAKSHAGILGTAGECGFSKGQSKQRLERSQGTTDHTTKKSTNDPSSQPSPASSHRWSFSKPQESTWKSHQFRDGRNRSLERSYFRDRRIRGDRSRDVTPRCRDVSSCDELANACVRKSDHGGMGRLFDHMGPQASRKDFQTGHESGSRLLQLESGQVSQSPTGATGVCALRTAEDPSGDERGVDQFRSEVEETRQMLNQPSLFDQNSNVSNEIERTIDQFEDSLNTSTSRIYNDRQPLLVLEVYANPNSPLTEAIQALGYKAMRFTKEDGDLNTFSGRQKLWSIVEKFQPEHIWVAPECGPWSGWNHLNQHRSPQMFDMIEQKQIDQLPHAKLCQRLAMHQLKHDRHFHFEQPSGSTLFNLKVFEELREKAVVARFDMCQFGLCIPKTNRFLRKRSQVLTTSRQMFHALHQQFCTDQHEHQRLEDNMSIDGCQQKLTSFCATYCSGFARMIARIICHRHHSAVGPDEAIMATSHVDERPSKRLRSNLTGFKRQKIDHDHESSSTALPIDLDDLDMPGVNPNQVEPSGSELSDRAKSWKAVLLLAQRSAPRVGNHRCSADSEVWIKAQELLKDQCQVADMFVCRGTERFQIPLTAPKSSECPLRYTICLHRKSGEVHDLGLEDWHRLTRAQRIRKCIPSRLTLTIFGHKPVSESAPALSPEPRIDMSNPADNEPPSAIRVKGNRDLPMAVHERTSNDSCEGWAPPPIPLHGPCFRRLTDPEKQDLIKIHKNLGHPEPLVLARHLKANGAADHIVEAAKEYVCDACVESTRTLHQRPSKLHNPKDFNELVGIDGFYWTGRAGFQVMVFIALMRHPFFTWEDELRIGT